MRTRNVQCWKRRLAISRLHLWLNCYLTILLLTFPMPVFAQSSTKNVTLIEVELARHVATGHVHSNNNPYHWHVLDHMVLYDVDGNPNAYVFVFAKAESRFKDPADLRQHIEQITARMPAKQRQQVQASDEGTVDVSGTEIELYSFDDLATVITGATDDSTLILRHFRGAPAFWIEAVKMDTSDSVRRWAEQKGATHVIMVTPMDFRLVTTKVAISTAASVEKKATAVPLSGSAKTIAVQSKKSESISALQQKRQEREARMRRRIGSMPVKQRQRYEAALQERKGALLSQWDSKRIEWESAKSSVGEH